MIGRCQGLPSQCRRRSRNPATAVVADRDR
jgi:hypothetical protein